MAPVGRRGWYVATHDGKPMPVEIQLSEFPKAGGALDAWTVIVGVGRDVDRGSTGLLEVEAQILALHPHALRRASGALPGDGVVRFKVTGGSEGQLSRHIGVELLLITLALVDELPIPQLHLSRRDRLPHSERGDDRRRAARKRRGADAEVTEVREDGANCRRVGLEDVPLSVVEDRKVELSGGLW